MMKRVALVLGWIILAMDAGLLMLGILSLPPRGLMFALPFVFLIPGFVLGFIGAVLLWLGRHSSVRLPSEGEESNLKIRFQ